MSESLESLALLTFICLPWILVAVLRRTQAFWLPGAGLIVLSIYLFATVDPNEGHGGPAVIGSGWGKAIASMTLLYGLTCLVVAAWLNGRAARPNSRAARPPAADEFPTAIVVGKPDITAEVTKD